MRRQEVRLNFGLMREVDLRAVGEQKNVGGRDSRAWRWTGERRVTDRDASVHIRFGWPLEDQLAVTGQSHATEDVVPASQHQHAGAPDVDVAVHPGRK